MAPRLDVTFRPPERAVCPYCRTRLEEGEPSRTCVGCGAGYHEDCTVEQALCGILGCGGEFSRREAWCQDDVSLSERIRRRLRRGEGWEHAGARGAWWQGLDGGGVDEDWIEGLRVARPPRTEDPGEVEPVDRAVVAERTERLARRLAMAGMAVLGVGGVAFGLGSGELATTGGKALIILGVMVAVLGGLMMRSMSE